MPIDTIVMSEEPETDRPLGPSPFVDRRETPVRVALVCPEVRGANQRHTIAARAGEFEGLAHAIQVEIAFTEIVKVREVKPATFIGAGTVGALAARVKAENIELVLVDTALSPIQQRNLELETGAKVLDRTGLILEIFGERAATREGVLQVELAHLNYQKSRLVRSWTHLERQRGGFGFLGGPGETQIESDRRQLQDRIALIETRLDKVRKTRHQQRGPREAINMATVALVGYTNSGKSTLFNHLTGAEVFAQDLLFATLDTTLRKLGLPHGRDVMLSDTVGFVSDLPTSLVAAFRATLEEVVDADMIVHVRDISNPDHQAQAEDVLGVLAELGVKADKPMIEVWNKIDILPREADGTPAFLVPVRTLGNSSAAVITSALTGEGLDALILAIETGLGRENRIYRVLIPHAAGADVGWLYDHAEILEAEPADAAGTIYQVRVAPRHATAFVERFAGRISG